MEILADVELRPHNTFGLSARAHRFVRAASLEDLRQACDHARAESLECLVIGAGSNLVLTRDWPGLVIRVALAGISIAAGPGDRIELRAAAGQDWPDLVAHCLEQGWFGLENLALIPGTAGAAPVQNIGAYGLELADRLVELEYLDMANGATGRLAPTDCGFGYRTSVFKQAQRNRRVITSISLALSRTPRVQLGHQGLVDELAAVGVTEPSPADVFAATIRLRRAKLPDPARLGNAGSFFHNPIVAAEHHQRLAARFPGLPGWVQADGRVKLAAGWLIEQCGFRGARQGAAGVHHDQALVLVNHGGASGHDILVLAERIRATVHKTFGVELTIEPRVI